MYSVTKKIEFCYGHRLLDYDGICKHPHGHNAVAEIEVRSGSPDNITRLDPRWDSGFEIGDLRKDMYSVTKKIEFCYGHRLLEYDGICKHPHGHNAVAEIEVRSGSLDNRNMVCDFSDIKRIVKGWVDRELDHKMILREDDPLVEPLKRLGEPVFIVKSNPTVEHIAKLLYDYTHSQGFPVVRVTVWETPTSFATFGGEALGD